MDYAISKLPINRTCLTPNERDSAFLPPLTDKQWIERGCLKFTKTNIKINKTLQEKLTSEAEKQKLIPIQLEKQLSKFIPNSDDFKKGFLIEYPIDNTMRYDVPMFPIENIIEFERVVKDIELNSEEFHVLRYRYNKIEFLNIVKDNLGVYNKFGNTFVKSDGAWYLIYVAGVSSKGFHPISNVKILSDTILTMDSCIRDCSWWGQTVPIKLDLDSLTFEIQIENEDGYVGFDRLTEEDFQESLKQMQLYESDSDDISDFWCRQVGTFSVKENSIQLFDKLKSLNFDVYISESKGHKQIDEYSVIVGPALYNKSYLEESLSDINEFLGTKGWVTHCPRKNLDQYRSFD